MSANPILIERRTGYKAYRCSTCEEYGYDLGEMEDFLVMFVVPVAGMEPKSVRLNLCQKCLNQLENACYVALRERALSDVRGEA